jgi:mannitol/fructose-specific phosphotransferase system IIA component (Ntr-type)
MPDAADSRGFPVVDLPPAASASPEAADAKLVGRLVRSERLKPAHAGRVVSQVLHREAQSPTASGRGWALPHCKSEVIDDVLGVVGRSDVPIPWPGARDAQLGRAVCLLVTPASKPGVCLRALEAVSRRLHGR